MRSYLKCYQEIFPAKNFLNIPQIFFSQSWGWACRLVQSTSLSVFLWRGCFTFFRSEIVLIHTSNLGHCETTFRVFFLLVPKSHFCVLGFKLNWIPKSLPLSTIAGTSLVWAWRHRHDFSEPVKRTPCTQLTHWTLKNLILYGKMVKQYCFFQICCCLSAVEGKISLHQRKVTVHVLYYLYLWNASRLIFFNILIIFFYLFVFQSSSCCLHNLSSLSR